ncbi:MAG: DUF255 domain-containing protein [Candidatus Kapabacteria bacterium]|nr:DUF255 domain-containing protein [Candidatus Kapabacteria bacterium]
MIKFCSFLKKSINFTILLSFLILAAMTAKSSSLPAMSLDSALGLAKKHNKLIMIDGYTDWCKWCKVMDKETFSDHKVIDFLNKNFIPSAFDMETGDGLKLSMKYLINAYPTVFFLNSNGRLVYKIVGYLKPDEFIAELNKCLKPENLMKLTGYSDDLNIGYPDFYKNSYGKSGKKVVAKPEQIEQWLDGQNDLFSEINFNILMKFALNKKYFEYFLNNEKRYKEMYSEQTVSDKIENSVYQLNSKAGKEGNEENHKFAISIVDKYFKDNDIKEKNTMKFRLNSDYWRMQSKADKLIEIGEQAIKEEINNKSENLNELAWNLCQMGTDKKVLEEALKIIEASLIENEGFENLDTKANILKKLDRKADALKCAQKAIEKAKTTGQKTEETQKLIEELKK